MTDIIKIVRDIQKEKESVMVEPAYALFSEIIKEVTKRVKDELNKEVVEGTLEFHRTLNDIAFNIKNQ